MLADAPWIREAENYGIGYDGPEPDPVCPCCGKSCQQIFLVGGDPIGCDECVEVMEATDWAFEELEKQMEADRETEMERRACRWQ